MKKTCKTFSAIFAFFLILTNFVFAKEMKFENSKYTATWNFKDDFKGDINDEPLKNLPFNRTCPMYLQVWDHINEDMTFAISDGKSSLKFDFRQIIEKSKYPRALCPMFAFYEQENGIDVLYYSTLIDSCGKACIVSYDFAAGKVTLSPEVSVSDLFADAFSYNYSSLLHEIYARIFGKTPLESEQSWTFYTRWCDSLAGGWGEETFGSFEGNILTLDYTFSEYANNKINDRKHKLPAKILTSKQIINYYSNVGIENFTIKTDSSLTEGSTVYSADNMKEFSNIPWVPSKDIREETIKISSERPLGGIYFCNGFYSAARNDLYLKNNRVKEIEIIYPQSHGLRHKIILNDTAMPEFIPLLNINCTEITIKVLSVYDGTAYNDTCINAIYPVGLMSEAEYYNSQR
ncbi:MAG: hypothetical protein J5747_12715 [Spirochaetaceae bacterium]|nr:hypothetical protein [Spirochaetaceae bacterium]